MRTHENLRVCVRAPHPPLTTPQLTRGTEGLTGGGTGALTGGGTGALTRGTGEEEGTSGVRRQRGEVVDAQRRAPHVARVVAQRQLRVALRRQRHLEAGSQSVVGRGEARRGEFGELTARQQREADAREDGRDEVREARRHVVVVVVGTGVARNGVVLHRHPEPKNVFVQHRFTTVYCFLLLLHKSVISARETNVSSEYLSEYLT